MEPFLGEIKMFAGNFAPRNWAFCDGQLLGISQYDALFSLLGTIYGGDGRTTFGLPDLRGRIPIHMGTGPGLSNYRIGQKAGAENVTLTVSQLPPHTHPSASTNAPNAGTARGTLLATQTDVNLYGPNATAEMDPDASRAVGGNQQHTNIMPFQCIHYIIALFGIYPSRS